MGAPTTKLPAPLNVDPEVLNSSRTEDDTAIWSLRHIQILWSWAARPKPVQPSFPPISTIPCTSVARLSESDASPTPFPSAPILSKSLDQNAPVKPKTVLYLAYGSNMCAETFLGMRGIRPISQVNVSAPSLDLTFDLPGIPYREPCFANTTMRKIPGKKPPFDPPKFPPGVPDRPPIAPPTAQDADAHDSDNAPARRPPVWNKGLYGIVYEVTADDYAKIVATEGGGASYHDILVPCFVLPPSVRVPEKPTVPVPPMPFLAHTLYAPRLPEGAPDDDDNDKDNNNPKHEDENPNPTPTPDPDPDNPKNPHPKIPSWLAALLRPVRRPSADYAQPSARYLKLLRDGAREHDLPQDYQAYLGALQPYTVTTCRQRLGQVLFLGFWLPAVLAMMAAQRASADERGRSPAWILAVSTVVMNLVWLSYDCVGKRVFGDGERTEDPGEGWGGRRRRSLSFASGFRGVEEVVDEEKRALMGAYR